MAARSRWAIHWERRAFGSWARCYASWRARADGAGSRRCAWAAAWAPRWWSSARLAKRAGRSPVGREVPMLVIGHELGRILFAEIAEASRIATVGHEQEPRIVVENSTEREEEDVTSAIVTLDDDVVAAHRNVRRARWKRNDGRRVGAVGTECARLHHFDDPHARRPEPVVVGVQPGMGERKEHGEEARREADEKRASGPPTPPTASDGVDERPNRAARHCEPDCGVDEEDAEHRYNIHHRPLESAE